MSTCIKKIMVTAVAAVMVATVAVPPAAQAQTAEELQAQIDALLAQIADLQAQLAAVGGTTGGGISGIPAGFRFNQNLAQGTSNTDVMYLQILLNSELTPPIASSGAGSPGSETQFFGPITRGGVVRFQEKYASEILTPLGLTAGTGFFGPSSRTKANSILAVAPPPPPPPPPDDGDVDDGDVDDGDGITTPGAEGSLIVTLEATPASGATLVLSETKDVSAVKMKATGSDILVDRLDMQFDQRPWLYIAEMTISDGTTSKTVEVTESNSVEVTVGSKYYIRASGLGILVPKDTEKVVTVTMKAASGLPAGTTTKDITLTHIADSLRGTDGAGLTQTGPTADLSTRTITVKEGDTASLELSADASNPKGRAVIVQETTETADVELAVFKLKATGNDAILRTFEFKDSVASGTLDVVTLYDGNTALSSTSSIGTASSVIENINLTIPKDTTKVLSLKATVKKSQGNYETDASSTVASSSVSFTPDKTTISAEDATSFATATVTGSTVTPGAPYFYEKAPAFTLGTTSITAVAAPSGSTSPHRAEAKIRLNVTANGGDIYIQRFSTTQASSGFVASTSQAASITLIGETMTSNADVDGTASDDPWIIRSGETDKWIEWIGTLDNDVADIGGDVSVYALIQDINWGTSGSLAGGDEMWTTTHGQIHLADFKTSAIFIVGVRQ